MEFLRSLPPLPRLLQLACAAALAGGCFQDVEEPQMMGPTCTPGTLGCECANGLCGDGFTCSPSADICMPVDCEPGTIFCECDAGRCDPMLTCTLGACAPASGGSGVDPTTDTSTTGEPTTSGPTTLASTTLDDTTSTTASTMTTNPMTTEVETTLADTTADATDTGEPLDCVEENDNSCVGCFDCQSMPGQSCDAQSEACAQIGGCGEISGCLTQCGAGGLCFDDCCADHTQQAVDAALELFTCHKDNCISQYCPRFEVPECSGG